jgi:hypothetical protein
MKLLHADFYHDNVTACPGLRVAIASSWWEKFLGLMGRTQMPGFDCLWLQSCSSIHTCFMRIRIDIAFLNEQGVVVKKCQQLGPWRLSFCFGAKSVLEFSAGSLEKFGIEEGWKFICR